MSCCVLVTFLRFNLQFGIKPRSAKLHEFADKNYMRIDGEPGVHAPATAMLAANDALVSPVCSTSHARQPKTLIGPDGADTTDEIPEF